MNWLFLALVPPLVWSMASMFDKMLVSRYLKSGFAAAMLTNTAGLAVALVLLLAFPIQRLPLAATVVIFLSGVLWGLGRLSYNMSLEKEEASRVVPFLQANPLIILVVSTLFLGERMGYSELLAFALILTGVVLVSVRHAKGKFHISRALPWLVLANVFLAAAFMVLKTQTQADWWTAIVWVNAGFAATPLVLLPFNGNYGRVRERVRGNGAKVFALWLGVGLLTLVGRAAFFGALRFAPTAIVSVMASTQTMFVLFFAAIITAWAPHLLREEISLRIVAGKAFAIALIIAGVALLAVK